MPNRPTINEIYTTLKNRILNCEYEPGQLLFEKEIVDEFEVSRTPIREVINILNGEGLLNVIPKKGIQISPLSMKKIREIYEIRKLLEPLSISQAIRNINQSHIEYLSNLDKTLRESVNVSSAKDIFRYGTEIHLYIANISRNETLTRILKWLREKSYRGYVYYYKQYLDRCSDYERKTIQEEIINNHSKIVEALKERNEQDAIKYVLLDLDSFNRFASNY